MSNVRQSWNDAAAFYQEQASSGNRSAVFLLDVVGRLRATLVGSCLEARVWEECLGICVPEECRPERGTPWLAVVSEADEIDYSEDELGESPADLDPDCWRVELRGIVRLPAGGDEEQTLEVRRCFGGAAEVAQVIESLLPRLSPLPPSQEK